MSNSGESCLVNEYSYDVGLLAPAILIILVLAFMNRRVKLKLDLLDGRPGLPIVVNFLGKERNRLIIVMAFGATASSCFAMFIDTFFETNATSISAHVSSSTYGKAFRGLFYTLLYGIINYPFLACLHAKYKVIGYTIGILYAFIRCIVGLVLYLGCRADEDTIKIYKHLGQTHLLYGGILLNLPSVVCTVVLCASYALLLYRHLRQNYSRHAPCKDIFVQETDQNEPVAENIDNTHVMLLFQNSLHKLTSASEESQPWYKTITRKIYVLRPDFKFSTQLLSAVFVSFIFVYQLTLSLLLVVDLYKQYLKIEAKEIAVVLDYATVAFLIGGVIAVIQLIMFLKSHRADVLKIYQSRKGLIQDEIINPKTLVGKCLRFCGYQIGFTAIGCFVVSLSIFFLLSPIWACKIIDMFFGRDFLLERLKQIFFWLLPFVLYPLLIWLSVVLLCMFVFRDKTHPDLTVTIDNRRLYDNVSYFFFFLNILVGLLSALSRVFKGAALGVVFLCRLDRTCLPTGYKKLDNGFTAYLGFLNVLSSFRHPVMLCFCQILINERRKVFEPYPSSERPRVSTRALNRWFLATMLIRNPSLVRYRKKANWLANSAFSPEPTDNEYVTLEEVAIPVERLKSVHVY